jgi:AraC-like DNA-binding protein
MPLMPPSVAVTSTLAMVRAAEARGAQTADVLEQAELSRDTLEDPDARLPGPTALSVWNALRERTGDPALQLVAPTILPFGAYRVIDYMVAASATVGDGIRRFARFFGLIADAMELTIEAGPHQRGLRLALADGGPVPSVYVDYVFAALVGRIRMRIRPELRVARVELRRPAPPETTPYTDTFRAPIRFDADGDVLWFDADEWSAPTSNADEALARILEEHARILEQRSPAGVDTFMAGVQQAIVAALPEGGGINDVARTLHMSVRTLQRKLVARGATYRHVSDTLRRQLAEGYLIERGVSVAEVAFLLGFSDQTSFHRAFRRWTGEAPGRWRRRRH